jgi:hypothetical protein
VTAPDDALKTALEAYVAASSAADQLQLRSFPLGFNVMASAGTKEGTGASATVTYHVRRIDHLAGPTSNFASVADVEAHLDQLASLPRWRLDLTGNPEVREEPGGEQPFTTIADLATGEEVHVRIIDIEAATSLHIHAEEAPSPNWHRAD